MIPNGQPHSEILDRDRLVSELRKNIQGDVLESYSDRLTYSTDESIFTLMPSVIVAPKDEADVQAIVAIAQFFCVPITARGGGTGVAGQSIGSGIIIDFSQYFDRILDVAEDTAVVQPGVVLQRLNGVLAQRGLRFAPDPGSKANCTIGGMLATNASGPHCLLHGPTRNNVRWIRLVLSDGSVSDTSVLNRRFPTLAEKIAVHETLIRTSQPRTMKNSSGYALGELCKSPPDYARFLVGSEGTLALTTAVELRTVPVPRRTALAIFPYPSLAAAVRAVDEVRQTRPAAVELVDRRILDALARANSAFLGAIGLDDAEASLWVEWEGPAPASVDRNRNLVMEDPVGMSSIWALRSQASKYLHELGGRRRPLRCIEDCAVPLDQLEPFVAELEEIMARRDCRGAIFGHVGEGHLHVNPFIDVEAPDLSKRVEGLMDEVYTLALGFGGTISGEHGDGILRRKYVERQWAPLLTLFQQVKETFDPSDLFNPDKKFSLSDRISPPLRAFPIPAELPRLPAVPQPATIVEVTAN